MAKLADVTPDTIRYYEKQQMMDFDMPSRISACTRIMTFHMSFNSLCPTLGFPGAILIRIIVDPHRSGASYLLRSRRDRQARFGEVEARIKRAIKTMRRLSAAAQRCLLQPAHSSVYYSLKALDILGPERQWRTLIHKRADLHSAESIYIYRSN